MPWELQLAVISCNQGSIFYFLCKLQYLYTRKAKQVGAMSWRIVTASIQYTNNTIDYTLYLVVKCRYICTS